MIKITVSFEYEPNLSDYDIDKRNPTEHDALRIDMETFNEDLGHLISAIEDADELMIYGSVENERA